VIPVNTFIDSFVELLTEAYLGPPNPSATWFIDNEADSGVLGVLKGVSAKEASKSVYGNDARGSTIAAHVEHLRWSLAMANASMRGEPFESKWEESWDLVHADEAAWDRLRQELRAEFDALVAGAKSQTQVPLEYFSGVLALLPHAAYHLGTIRQLVERVRS
jgi:hypothetical protein